MREKLVICTDRLNCSRLINQMKTEKIDLYDLTLKQEELTFTVYGKDADKCIEVLESKKRPYKVVSQRRKKSWKKLLIEHLVSGFSWILVIATIVVASRFCYAVDINTDDIALKNKVEAILESEGLDGVFRKSAVDEKSLTRAILEGTENTAYADVEWKGCRLVISLKQAHEPMQEIPSYSAIYASCDCVITKVLTTSGTALVKEGDRVVKGQKLIDGYIDLKDPADPENVRQPVKAQGVVYGRVWESRRLNIADKYMENVRTGESAFVSEISIAGIEWNSNKQIEFERYEKETTTKTFGNLFPISVSRTTYYEIKTVEKTVDRAYIDNCISLAKVEMQSGFGGDWKIVGSWNFEKRLDNLYIIDIYYELEIPVWYGEE
ncbi:MAG: sporulation protein YqfD [Christensenellales bacterium]